MISAKTMTHTVAVAVATNSYTAFQKSLTFEENALYDLRNSLRPDVKSEIERRLEVEGELNRMLLRRWEAARPSGGAALHDALKAFDGLCVAAQTRCEQGCSVVAAMRVDASGHLRRFPDNLATSLRTLITMHAFATG